MFIYFLLLTLHRVYTYLPTHVPVGNRITNEFAAARVSYTCSRYKTSLSNTILLLHIVRSIICKHCHCHHPGRGCIIICIRRESVACENIFVDIISCTLLLSSFIDLFHYVLQGVSEVTIV